MKVLSSQNLRKQNAEITEVHIIALFPICNKVMQKNQTVTLCVLIVKVKNSGMKDDLYLK